MPTKHRSEIEKLKMTGWHWFPFDVVDWLTSVDVRRMTAAERGVYIDLLGYQWRDGYIPSDIHLLAKVTSYSKRMLNRWMTKWRHLFVTSLIDSEHLINVKLNKIAIEKGNPKAEGGTEERRGKEIREEDEETTHNRVVSSPPSAPQSENQLVAGYTQEQIATQAEHCKDNPWVKKNDNPKARLREGFVKHLMEECEPPRRVPKPGSHAEKNPELHTGIGADGKPVVGWQCTSGVVCLHMTHTDNDDKVCDACKGIPGEKDVRVRKI
jgi:hypothetical protein